MQLFIIAGGAFAKRTRRERDVGMVNFDNPRIRNGALGIRNDLFFHGARSSRRPWARHVFSRAYAFRGSTCRLTRYPDYVRACICRT